ncbi:MAG: aminopeptidase N C-terminal domain-containing protein, partial [Mariprofundaceae bacterium]|nr:aminopeptidase N C-terminal domain-containing protein [Mariprofundaceae bacterium]
SLEPALKAEMLLLPSEADIAEALAAKNLSIDPAAIHLAREKLRAIIATDLQTILHTSYQNMSNSHGLSDHAMQQRKLRNICLSYLIAQQDNDAMNLAYQQFQQAGTMTDQFAALSVLVNCDCEQRTLAIQSFEKQWSHESNVMDKWFSAQASSSRPDTLKHVQSLMSHPKFDIKNPNKVRALIGTFAMRNPNAFHAIDGKGYEFIAEQVLILDKLNPQIASRMVRAFMNWKHLEPTRQILMKQQLQRIADDKDLSNDVYEIVSKALQ